MVLRSATFSTLLARSPQKLLLLLLPMLLAVVAASAASVDEDSKAKTPSLLRNTKTTGKNNNNHDSGHNRKSRGLIVSRKRQPKIIGGDPIGDPNRYPYFALMDGSNFCGAVLVSKRFVLTAAHCVGADDDFEVGIASRKGRLGGSKGSDGDGDDVVDYPYRAKRVHPDYDDDTLDADLALYELERDVEDTDLVPIRIEKDAITMSGTELTAIGFGDTNPSEYIDTVSKKLREVTLYHVPLADCRDDFGSGYPLTEGMMCAFEFGEDTCQGDSGGPLIRKGETPSDDGLVGLVSWGLECGGDLPGVYTRISHYYDWINKEMCALNSAAVPDYMDCSGYETDVADSGSGGGSGGGDSGSDGDDLFGGVGGGWDDDDDDNNDFGSNIDDQLGFDDFGGWDDQLGFDDVGGWDDQLGFDDFGGWDDQLGVDDFGGWDDDLFDDDLFGAGGGDDDAWWKTVVGWFGF